MDDVDSSAQIVAGEELPIPERRLETAAPCRPTRQKRDAHDLLRHLRLSNRARFKLGSGCPAPADHSVERFRRRETARSGVWRITPSASRPYPYLVCKPHMSAFCIRSVCPASAWHLSLPCPPKSWHRLPPTRKPTARPYTRPPTSRSGSRSRKPRPSDRPLTLDRRFS